MMASLLLVVRNARRVSFQKVADGRKRHGAYLIFPIRPDSSRVGCRQSLQLETQQKSFWDMLGPYGLNSNPKGDIHHGIKPIRRHPRHRTQTHAEFNPRRPLRPNESIAVTVVLRHRPSSRSHESLAELAARGQRLTLDELTTRYGADPEDVRKVEEFARAHGLKAANVNLSARTLTLSGTVHAFCQAFRVDLAHYEHALGGYRGCTGPIQVPIELKDVIHDVLG